MGSKVCFTGFTVGERERLTHLAAARGMDVVKSVVRSLDYLVAGPNAGPTKLRDAREQHVAIMNERQFEEFLISGTLPQSDKSDYASAMTVGIATPNVKAARGILDLSIVDTPTAIIDFETTGLSAGIDRVVEVSVIRREPSGQAEVVFDTLVNPRRPMGATEIHGITDADVADAPSFEDVAGGLAKAISGCVLAAYNVYFDMRFFSYEMQRAGIYLDPPHVCLMYLRPLLGLGPRCSLGDACEAHSVPYSGSHMAGDDAEASAKLMEHYFSVMQCHGIRSFHDLAQRGTYKFLRSFERDICRCDSAPGGWIPERMCSRRRCHSGPSSETVPSIPSCNPKPRNGLALYWDGLKAAVADLQIDDDELGNLAGIVEQYGLAEDQVRMLHARAFASVIVQFIGDQRLDDRGSRKLKRLHQCLSRLGWAPGE